MSCVVELSRSRLWPRVAALTLMTLSVAACSGDASRFSDSPFRGNPDATGSIPQGQGAPVAQVDSQPLPQTAASTGTAGGGRGMASFTPGSGRPTAGGDVTGSVASAPKSTGHWT